MKKKAFVELVATVGAVLMVAAGYLYIIFLQAPYRAYRTLRHKEKFRSPKPGLV